MTATKTTAKATKSTAKTDKTPAKDDAKVEDSQDNLTPAEIAAKLGISEPNNVGRPISETTKKIYAELDNNVTEIGGNHFSSVLYKSVGITPNDKGKQKVYRAVSKWCDNRMTDHNENWTIDRKISGKDGYAVRMVPSEN